MQAQPFPHRLAKDFDKGEGSARGELRSQTSTGLGGTSEAWPRPEGRGAWGPHRGRLPSHAPGGAHYLEERGTARLTAGRGPRQRGGAATCVLTPLGPSGASPRPPRRPGPPAPPVRHVFRP